MASRELAKFEIFGITPFEGASNVEQFDHHAVLYTAFAKLAINGKIFKDLTAGTPSSVLSQQEVLNHESRVIARGIGWYLCELYENNYSPGFTSEEGIPAKELSVIHDDSEDRLITSGKFVDTQYMRGVGIGLPNNFIYGQDLLVAENGQQNGSLPKNYVINAHELADFIKNRQASLEVGEVKKPPA